MDDATRNLYFQLFNEIAIIEQLSRNMFEARLPHGIGVPQFAVLNHLVRVRDGQTPLALARAFQTPKTSMTHTLSLLQRAGLVDMRDNPEDGRSKQVWITPEGARFRLEAIKALTPDLAEVAIALPEDTVLGLLPTLRALRAFLDTRRDS